MKNRKEVNKRLHTILLLPLFVVCMILSFGVVCRAETSDAESENTGVDGILTDFESILPDGIGTLDDANKISESVGIKRILSEIIATVSGEKRELSLFLASLLGVCLMSALASQFDGELSTFASRCVLVVFSVMMLDKLYFLLNGTVDSLKEINSFFKAVIPVTVAVNSLGVSPTTASTQALGMGLTLGAYSFVSAELLTPIVGAIFVCSAACVLDPVFERLSIGVRNIFISVFGVLTVLAGATFSLQSVISSGADSALIRSARYAVSSAIPIVGNTVSGALGIALGSVSYARGIVGGGAIAVVISLLIAPLITVLSYRMCLKLGSAFCSLCAVDSARGVLNAFIGAIDTLLAVYSLTCIIYVVELAAFLKGGVGVA